MTSYPQSPGDGDNEQTRSSSQAGGGSGGYPAPGQPGQPGQGPGQSGYQQAGGYPGSYQPGGYGQPGYGQSGYPSAPTPAAQGGYQAGQPSYYSQPGYPGSYPAGRGGPEGQPPSFFGALFDVNFSRFATPSVIKVLYILIMIVVALVWLGYVVVGFLTGEPVLGLIAFVGGGLVALVTITFYRIVLEFFYAVVRMSEDIHNRR